jgi:Tfp pilus assembly protein PilN
MINLLPPEYKKELRGEERFRFVLILGFLFTVFLLCLSLALLSIRVYVWGQISVQQILIESQMREGKEVHVPRIQELNRELQAVQHFYESRTVFSDLIARIETALPPSVYLTSFSYTPGSPNAKITLRGFAPQTEDLLALREHLQTEESFVNFHFPATNWNRPVDIDFSFEFEL